MRKILVIGSTNVDMIAKVNEFPKPGETIEGISFMQAHGGKGANQAMAAHKLGGEVKFITCLGNDNNSKATLEFYKEMGLDVSSSLIKDDVPMGTAIIMVNEEGENIIVIIPGANAQLSPEYVDLIEDEIAESEIILLQMEIPYESVKRVCQLAAKHKTRVVLNVAPAYELDDDLIKYVDILVVNETEIEAITKRRISDAGEDSLIDDLLNTGVNHVILTLGRNGSIIKGSDGYEFISAYEVDTIDSTAAGDTFCGALVAKLSNGDSLQVAAKYASAAAAICVTRMGAQPSIPTLEEVENLISRKGSEQAKDRSVKYKNAI